MAKEYINHRNARMAELSERVLSELPKCCNDFLDSEIDSSRVTENVYIRRISKFMRYIVEEKKELRGIEPIDLTLDHLNSLTLDDVSTFINRMTVKKKNGDEVDASRKTKANYWSALNKFFLYMEKTGKIDANPLSKTKRPSTTIDERRFIRLDDDEEERFLNCVKTGEGLAKNKLAAQQKNAIRDYAICLTLIRTGMRVSELVGLNIGEVDFDKCSLSVTRKGGGNDTVYFSDDVKDALMEYLGDKYSRASKEPLFTVSQGKYKGNRLSVRSVEHIVTSYASYSVAGKRITPHKLRATYATNMLRETGNIELVKEELGHKKIETTTLYIDKNEQAKAEARNILQQRAERIQKSK